MAGKVTVKKQAVVSVKAKPTKKYAKKSAKNLKAGEEAELKSMGLFKICVNSISNDTKKFTVGNNEIQELQLTAFCPFCKAPYSAETKIQHRVGAEKVAVRDVRVNDLVATPYAYQSFDANAPAYIATPDEYHAMLPRYETYLRKMEAQRLRESLVEARRQQIPSNKLLSLLDAVTWQDFERLQTLQQSGRFRRHSYQVLNFIEAIEFLHERGLDGGFLQRIADEHNNERRYNLMQDAYEIGWDGQDEISPQLTLSLLQRNGLVEVINLLSDSDNNSSNDNDSDS